MESTLSYLQKLTRESHKPEAEILSLAFRAGLRQLWRDHVLGRYLRDEIPREEAVAMVGIDWVDLAERQHEAMREDLEWALET